MWSSLPTDLVDSIEEGLVLYIDKVRLRCVCSSWRSHLPKLSNHSVGPWLLLPDNLGSRTCGFWNPLEKNVYKLDFPEAGDQIVFRGSDYGWVVVHDNNDAIYALNPLTRARVWLPPRSKFPDIREYNAHNQDNEYQIWEGVPAGYNFTEYYSLGATHVRNGLLQKVVFSSNPACSDFVAVAIFGEFAKLAYCKCGDNKWSFLDEDLFLMEDVLFHGGQLYVVQHRARLVVFDNIMNAGSNSCPKTTFKEIVPTPTRLLLDKLYLCWSSSTGRLMLVRRDLKYDAVNECDEYGDEIITLETVGFEIFKLDTIAQTWCEVKSLGDDVLFLGLNSTISFSALDFPSYKRNCIYFADTQLNSQIKGTGRDLDVGAFSLDEEKFQHFRAYVGDSKAVWPSPIWVVSSPFN